MNKETLLIHEITEDILQLDLSKYILTFDDGLYSQYFYWNLLKDIPTTKIFFISSGAIRLEETLRPQFAGNHVKFPTHTDALASWFKGDREPYMTLGELKKMRDEGAIIGAHGHMHIKQYDENCLLNRQEQFRKDNKDMFLWFSVYLRDIPKHYSFPYQEHRMQRAVVNLETGIKEFYGKERKDVRDLV